MTIQWTDAAIEAATSEAKRWREGSRFWVGKPPVYLVCRDENILSEYSDRSARDAALDDLCMRAALDAAVKAQGFPYPRGFYCEPEMIQAIAKARADALEEAAKWFDEQGYVAGARDLRFLKENSDA